MNSAEMAGTGMTGTGMTGTGVPRTGMMRTTDQYMDGNVLAGPLREVFAIDVTSAVGQCASCGLADRVAALQVYAHAPGYVARCPGCGEVVLRLVRGPVSAWLDLRGALSLRIPLPPDAPAPSAEVTC